MNTIKLLLRNQDKLYKYCLKLCNCKHKAKDLLQDVNEKVINKQEEISSKELKETLFFTMVYNLFIDNYRYYKRHQEELFNDFRPIDYGENPIERREITLKANEIIDKSKLPNKYKEIMYKVIYKGEKSGVVKYDAKKIANSLNTTKSYITYSYFNCRKMLKRDGRMRRLAREFQN